MRKILKQKRKTKEKLAKKRKDNFGNSEFSIYEENIIYIVILLIMESFFLQFNSSTSCSVKMDYGVKKVKSIYEKEYLPLALELYTHHVMIWQIAK